MRKNLLFAPLAALLCAAPATAQEEAPKEFPSPNAIVAAAAATEWQPIAASDLLVMDLAPDAKGEERRVIIQLMPPPFSQGWIRNIRKLAAAKFWDGTSINRVQDNYVVQWGDAGYDNPESGETEQKALPEGLEVTGENEYSQPASNIIRELLGTDSTDDLKRTAEEAYADGGVAANRNIVHMLMRDAYAARTSFVGGFPFGFGGAEWDSPVWPVHCYGMVGVGRNLSPDTGTGAELYTVIGHAPRHLDRNIALVGRIVEGMEHLSSLPRGKGQLGFYADPEKRVPITAVRLASDLPAKDQPEFRYLDTESNSFARYAEARANRRDPFFIKPAGGADICNIPVPVRRVTAD
ncbi:peptidylprolyl isomerase [Parasphingorhabdus marina DSM 22363]|uniref:peptidylprolyl isomerase n=1 Tax=Parasphingorhabdus marina DSM 22363 TaxID=1123272 RepID=A0A1N6CNG6_9SPHN|nr:peptidylprolyl isomerase [Parasphingorhabdus marina]SIN60009.1 peptidylprolyl isomerase [Parasphingorhabdus marina DSM 22363]